MLKNMRVVLCRYNAVHFVISCCSGLHDVKCATRHQASSNQSCRIVPKATQTRHLLAGQWWCTVNCRGIAASSKHSEVTLTLIARFMEPTWGLSGADRTQVGPMLAPWTLLSGKWGASTTSFKIAFDECVGWLYFIWCISLICTCCIRRWFDWLLLSLGNYICFASSLL